MEKRSHRPGEHGKKRHRMTDYAMQLREKQKVKAIYGVMEKQFMDYFKEADSSKGVTGEILLQLLERRLDNTILRMGFATSKKHARQLVSHGQIFVNDKRVNIPSSTVNQGDEVSLKCDAESFKKLKKELEVIEDRPTPGWITVGKDGLKGVVNRLPQREDITFSIQEQLIVDFYSK